MEKKTGNRAPRKLIQLSDARIRSLSVRGYYCDGGGLYLQVQLNASGNPRRSWIFRYRMNDRLRDMGLGSYVDVSLAEAREKAAACRKKLHEGIDPCAKRIEQRETEQELDAWTFARCTEAYFEQHQSQWRNQKHAAQWLSTLKTYAFPHFGNLPVRHVDTQHILACLEPIWYTKHETAHRLKGRIRVVLEWAASKKYKDDRNPADSPSLKYALPRTEELKKFESHSSLPYDQLPAFNTELRGLATDAARGLEFLIYTAARTGEVIGATWEEIDLDEKIWSVPKERMKAGIEHWVPLSAGAIDVLNRVCPDPKMRTGPIFKYRGRPLSDAAFRVVMARLGKEDFKPHGMRATFRTWGAEETRFENEALEHSLAHGLDPKSVRARYIRGTLMKKRRNIMAAWSQHCNGKPIPKEFDANHIVEEENAAGSVPD